MSVSEEDYRRLDGQGPETGPSDPLPRIRFDLRDHKRSIIITWSILVFSGGILPIILYFSLRYGAQMKLSLVLAITTAIFGVASLLSLARRTWSLVRKGSDCRPLDGSSRWAMDFFNLNFIVGFVVISVVVIIGNTKLDVRIVALGLPFLITEVCLQLLLAAVLSSLSVRLPFRVSSVRAYRPIRSGVYAIVEDIVAVDGGMGTEYRRQLQERWHASRAVRRLCKVLDWLWGISGVLVGIATIVVLFAVPDENLGYVLGWMMPWTYAGVMAWVTIWICQAGLKDEKA